MKEEPSLWLKFSGEDLDVRSIPIYELGDTLVAVQRIIHKTFLFENDRLKKHAQLTQEERRRLSLQISESINGVWSRIVTFRQYGVGRIGVLKSCIQPNRTMRTGLKLYVQLRQRVRRHFPLKR